MPGIARGLSQAYVVDNHLSKRSRGFSISVGAIHTEYPLKLDLGPTVLMHLYIKLPPFMNVTELRISFESIFRHI